MPNGIPTNLPGANVLEVVMAAPTDLLSLATRNTTDVLNTLNIGAQRLASAAAIPPIALPGSVGGLTLPQLPGFPMMGSTPAQAPAQTQIGAKGGEVAPMGYSPRSGVQAYGQEVASKPGFII